MPSFLTVRSNQSSRHRNETYSSHFHELAKTQNFFWWQLPTCSSTVPQAEQLQTVHLKKKSCWTPQIGGVITLTPNVHLHREQGPNIQGLKGNVTLARPSQREYRASNIAWLEPQKEQKFKFIAALEIPARKDESTCRLLAETSLFWPPFNETSDRKVGTWWHRVFCLDC